MTDKEVMIKLTFIFDPSDTWQRYSELEIDLAKWLESKGLEAKRVSMKGSGENIYHIRKIPLVEALGKRESETPKGEVASEPQEISPLLKSKEERQHKLEFDVPKTRKPKAGKKGKSLEHLEERMPPKEQPSTLARLLGRRSYY